MCSLVWGHLNVACVNYKYRIIEGNSINILTSLMHTSQVDFVCFFFRLSAIYESHEQKQWLLRVHMHDTRAQQCISLTLCCSIDTFACKNCFISLFYFVCFFFRRNFRAIFGVNGKNGTFFVALMAQWVLHMWYLWGSGIVINETIQLSLSFS